MIYVVEKLNHEHENPVSNYRYFANISAAWRYISSIQDIWPKAEAWLWSTAVQTDDEICLDELICHLRPALGL